MALDAVGDSRALRLAQLWASDPLRGEFVRMQDADRALHDDLVAPPDFRELRTGEVRGIPILETVWKFEWAFKVVACEPLNERQRALV
jgi:hypothetical protein